MKLFVSFGGDPSVGVWSYELSVDFGNLLLDNEENDETLKEDLRKYFSDFFNEKAGAEWEHTREERLRKEEEANVKYEEEYE